MTERTLIFLGIDQTLEHVPERPVATATWVLEDLTEDLDSLYRVLDSGSAVVSGVQLVTDDDAGWSTAEPDRIPVTSTASASTGPWWLEDAEGVGELVLVDGIASGEALRARWPLARNYASGSTITSLVMTASIDDAVAADEDLLDHALRIVWTYQIDGRTIVRQEQVKIRRQQVGEGVHADVVQFAIDYFPELPDQVRDTSELERWTKLARRLVDNRFAAHGRGIDRAQLMVGDRAVQLQAFKLLEITANNGLHPAHVTAEDWRKSMREAFEAEFVRMTQGHPGLDAAETDEDGEQRIVIERASLDFSW